MITGGQTLPQSLATHPATSLSPADLAPIFCLCSVLPECSDSLIHQTILYCGCLLPPTLHSLYSLDPLSGSLLELGSVDHISSGIDSLHSHATHTPKQEI